MCLHTDPMGIHRACVLIEGVEKVTSPEGNHPENISPILRISPLIAHQLASARHNLSRFANIDSRIRSSHPVPVVVSGSGVNRPAGKVWPALGLGSFAPSAPNIEVRLYGWVVELGRATDADSSPGGTGATAGDWASARSQPARYAIVAIVQAKASLPGEREPPRVLHGGSPSSPAQSPAVAHQK